MKFPHCFVCDSKLDKPGIQQVSEGSGEEGKMEKTGCEIICGAQTTLAVKGLMMMVMMMMMMMSASDEDEKHLNYAFLTSCVYIS